MPQVRVTISCKGRIDHVQDVDDQLTIQYLKLHCLHQYKDSSITSTRQLEMFVSDSDTAFPLPIFTSIASLLASPDVNNQEANGKIPGIKLYMRVSRFGSQLDWNETMETLSSGSSGSSTVEPAAYTTPAKILEVFTKGDSAMAVRKLSDVAMGRIPEDLLSDLYCQAVDGSTGPKEAADVFYSNLCTVELNNFVQDETVGKEKNVLLPTATFDCICCAEEDLPYSKKFTVWCGNDSHSICYDCVESYLRSQLESGQANIECFGTGCRHVLSLLELELALGRGNAEQGRHHELLQEIDDLKLHASIDSDAEEYCTCPNEGCNWIVARSQPGAIEEVTCDNCMTMFCSSCRGTYHYRTTCLEATEFRHAWHSWILQGRSAYWADNKAMRKRAHRAAKDNKRIKAVIKAEKKDEDYKAKNCRMCPHCGRVAERIAGCAAMRCGHDTDTQKNKQNGCGKSFDWHKAKAYTPVLAGQHVKAPVSPSRGAEKTDHADWCSNCGKDILGLRFECLHCKSFSLCENCDSSRSDWSRPPHPSSHIFRIHTSK